MSPKNPEEFHQKLSLVFHALLALPITAFIYLFLELRHRDLSPALNNRLFLLIATYGLPILGVLVAALGYFWFRKSLVQTVKDEILPLRLQAYGGKVRLFYYYITVSAVIWVLGLYFTTSPVFIIGYVFLLFFMSFQRPTPQRYVKDLSLEGEDKEIILHKKEFKSLE